MNSAGGRYQHAHAAREKGRVVDPLVIFFQKVFGVGFQMIDARVEGKEGGVIKTLKLLFEIHESLPRDLNSKICERMEALFHNIPVG